MMFLDFATSAQIGFTDPASPIMEGIINLHHAIFFFLILILTQVLWMLGIILLRGSIKWHSPDFIHMDTFRKKYLILNNLVHGITLEIVWTIIPSLILMLIAIPSFALLYSIDEIHDPELTIKVVGHQWFWYYDYSEQHRVESYMLPFSQLNPGDLRLLEVDQRLVCPINTHLRFLVTSSDVLHSFAVPSLGIKIDTVPGRLNQVSCYIKREGIFYGQCSELCGVNHAFMPIVVQAISRDLWEQIKN